MSKSKTDETGDVVAYTVRVPQSVLDRCDKLTDKFSRPGMPANRADVVRMAIYQGLEQIEKEARR